MFRRPLEILIPNLKKNLLKLEIKNILFKSGVINCKCPDSNIAGFRGHNVSVCHSYLTLLFQCENSYGQFVSKLFQQN